MILLRTTDLAPEVLELADSLKDASGSPVVMLVDERRGPVGTCRHPKLGFDKDAYAGLGLHMPPDVGWRCGDYGFYLARQRFPDVERFWMFEFDVRLLGDARRFFELADSRTDLDLIVARLAPTDDRWWWWSHLAASDARPWRCFFPVLRLSGRAIDLLHIKRKEQSRSLWRTALWPNDEGFVATTIGNSDLRHADLNDLGQRLYDDATFTYEMVIDGANGTPSRGPPKLMHPVLTGDAYHRKLARMKDDARPDPPFFSIRRAVVRRVNRLRTW